MVAIGSARFADMLAGFRAMDVHFATAPPAANVPLLMGLLAVWNRNFLDVQSTAVLPYSRVPLAVRPTCSELTMESNGKSVRIDGTRVDYQTGTSTGASRGPTANARSFYQLLHQGTSTVSCDVVVVARSENPLGDQQDMLVANALAQASVLTSRSPPPRSRPMARRPNRRAQGHAGQPAGERHHGRAGGSFTLGALVALYEHSTFVQGAVWGIDSFDQWGVELGKKVAMGILGDLTGAAPASFDPSTDRSIALYRSRRRRRPGAAGSARTPRDGLAAGLRQVRRVAGLLQPS